MKIARTFLIPIIILIFGAGIVAANHKVNGSFSIVGISKANKDDLRIISRVGASIIGRTGNSSAIINTGKRNFDNVLILLDNHGNLLSSEILKPDYRKIAKTPQEFKLFENFPNPFNPSTVIPFDIPEAARVTIKIYNIRGQEVATLLNGKHSQPGSYRVRFDASHLSSGIYLCRINAGSYQSVKKMMLLK